MKQVLQNIGNGETQLVDVPCPKKQAGQLLIATSTTLVSAGTERMLIDFGKANWLEKARTQPDKVKLVLDKVKTDGLAPTIGAVRSKLDQPLPLGYCNVGRVIEAPGTDFEGGERVVSNGYHAEVVRVPKNLCARIPDEVDDESAAFTVIGAIALQGIRLVSPTVGETVVVTGLGLIGLLAVQLLRANGCRVLGIDFDTDKCAIARKFGAETVDLSKGEDPIAKATTFSRGRGVDGVVITASTTSNGPVSQAAKMCRKRGRIVLVGVAGLELSRADFFEKEITFQVSCSYGPGRYDDQYEQKGHDYPVGFVRWTEQRNFEAILDLMAMGQIDVKPLITHRFDIDNALKAYQTLGNRSALGILLNYSGKDLALLTNPTVSLRESVGYGGGSVVIGCIGAGNYASRVLIPAFREAGACLDTVVTSGGVSAVHHGNKNAFSTASTDAKTAYSSSSINTIVIATQHNQHARQVCDALISGKHVFVEKPLALTLEEIDEIEKAYDGQAGKCQLMVGYNRRFATHVQKMKVLLSSVTGPKAFIMTMNAGAIPENHWTQDQAVGGGRIIGEACHYIDLMRYLVGRRIASFDATCIGGQPGVGVTDDKASITLTFEDGSFGTIHYLANGGKTFPKERIEVFANDAVLQLDNFRKLVGFGWPGFKTDKLFKQDKGQVACARAFVEAITQGKPAPINFDEILEVARVSVEVASRLRDYSV
jgi:predicted dehydrogenase/threonine dehydrogenase-like Zn-dependent dehydrogenase